MRRRYWPVALALLSILVFGSYLVYTDYLVRRIREEALIHTQMYATIQRGLFSIEEDASLRALLELQNSLQKLGVPTIVLDPTGRPTAAVNLPFKPSFNTDTGKARIGQYAARLARENAPIDVPNLGTLYFGPPPITSGLRWIPWLQTGGAVLLVVIALAIIRSSVREERERLWAAMERELAHQMGTPLSSLAGWIEVLRLPPDEREQMASMHRIADVVGADVERLERVSRRFELIGKPPRLEPVRVTEIIGELDRYFRPRLPRFGSGVELRTRVRDELPMVEANRVLLVWALENVVKNAIDALAGRGGRILILAAPTEVGGVEINIADDGPGIATSVKDRIFLPGVTTKSSGWGVGLSLTRRIIEDLHGGRIAARARKRGGTVFDVVLPRQGAKRRARGVFRTAEP
ncbi:MAG: sensor histidine kinase [Gemmatimonadota bacterium]